MNIVFLPMYSQPHITGLWMRFFDRWQDEVDKLMVTDRVNGHGIALDMMLKKVFPGDKLLFMEEDGIIFKPGIVKKYFDLLDLYDVIGSPRMSCHPKIAMAAAKKWGLDYSGIGDRGPNFWPNMFFVKAECLLQTDRDFGAKSWNPGERIDLINLEIDEPMSGDTLVWASLQLRNLGLKILEIPQYHCMTDDSPDYRANTNIFDGNCGYFHLGSLSGNIVKPHSEQEQLEMERRVMWNELAGKEMSKEVEQLGLSRGRIEERKKMYREVTQLYD